MDLGILGKKALVCASSKGLGFGCAVALANAGVDVTMCARNEGQLIEAGKKIRKVGVQATIVVCDITTQDGVERVLEKIPNPDILINNAGGPPPGSWETWTNDDFLSAIQSNMLTPIKLIQRVLPSMIENRWGRIVNITSGAVKAPIPALGLSNTARAGLTGFVAGVSRQVAKYGISINNALPGVHDTDRIKGFDETMAKSLNISIEEAREKKALSIPVGRYGDADEFGNICAFLCSQHASFIIGQNIVIDGGAINATI
ncbi:MAG: SDR family oxidoreductase [Paracoccaceae bacterium]|nr:SDR family oxidoreductase [Paracoccaceae bacterium]